MRKKKKFPKIIIIFLFIICLFFLLYYFINDNNKNIFIIDNLKNLTANISNITFINKNNYLNKNLIKEINNDYKKEIKDLKEILDLNTLNSNKTFINATTIKRSNNYWYSNITIDKGRKDNIKEGYAVINSRGLIGKIIKVNYNSSEIKLLTSYNKDIFLSAVFSYDNNLYYGLITKYNYKTNELILSDVIGDFDKKKLINTDVTTSGITDSFTSGLLIGKIKSIKKNDFGTSNTITLTPSVNFNDINIVSVVVGDK